MIRGAFISFTAISSENENENELIVLDSCLRMLFCPSWVGETLVMITITISPKAHMDIINQTAERSRWASTLSFADCRI